MAPTAVAESPPPSALEEAIIASKSISESSAQPPYLDHLATTVLHNLRYQHDWTSLTIHTHASLTSNFLPRLIISGLPPKRAYIHPDEQIAIIQAEHETGKSIEQLPELEWVLPLHWEEKWTLARFAEVFDALDTVPPTDQPSEEYAEEVEEESVGHQWRGQNRQKRLLLAMVHDDSTINYYIMHDGIVKPRQN